MDIVQEKIILWNKSEFSAAVGSVLRKEVLKGNKIDDIFRMTFGLLKTSWIAIDSGGFELLHQLGALPKSSQIFLLRIFFQITMKQVLIY